MIMMKQHRYGIIYFTVLFLIAGLLVLNGCGRIVKFDPGSIDQKPTKTCSDVNASKRWSFRGTAANDGRSKWNGPSTLGPGVSVNLPHEKVSGIAVGDDKTLYVAVVENNSNFNNINTGNVVVIERQGSGWTINQQAYDPYTVLGTPAVGADGTVYTVDKAGVLRARKFDTRLDKWTDKWKKVTFGGIMKFSPVITFVNSGIICEEVIVFGIGNTIYARKTADGTELWTQPVVSDTSGTVAVASNTVFVGSEAGILHALSLETGIQLDQFTPTSSSAPIHSPATHINGSGGITVVFGQGPKAGGSSEVHGLTFSGNIFSLYWKWTKPTGAQHPEIYGISGPPAISEDGSTAYALFFRDASPRDTILYAIDMTASQKGSTKWFQSSLGWNFGGTYKEAAPIIGQQGKVYFMTSTLINSVDNTGNNLVSRPYSSTIFDLPLTPPVLVNDALVYGKLGQLIIVE